MTSLWPTMVVCTLNGGDGNDVLETFEGSFSDSTLNGGAGADTLKLLVMV